MTYLPPNFLTALRRASSELETLVEISLDGGTRTFSQVAVHGTPVLDRISQIKHKLQPAYGKSSLAKVSFDLIDPSEWRDMVAHEYIKNRRVNVEIGPRGEGSASFYTVFTGVVVDFSVSGQRLTIEVQDDLYVAKKKVPEENATKTQSLAFQNTNAIDIKKMLLSTHGEIPAERLDTTGIDDMRDTYFVGWTFDRVLTKPVAIKNLINELDEQTLSMTFTDGDKITMAAFAPPKPGQTLLHLDDDIVPGSLSVQGGMVDHFVNHCVVYYDYNESGDNDEDDYDAVAIVSDTTSQSNWGEVARKEIRSKWIRTRTIAQPTNVTGVVIYHVNYFNDEGSGTLAYDSAAGTLTWTSPGDTAGAAVTVDRDGKFQLFSNDTSKYIRVVVTQASLPGSNQSDSLAITLLPGAILATALASHHVMRYTDPQAEMTFNLGLVDAIHLDRFLKVSDVIEISQTRIITKGKPRWRNEKVFLLAANPDFRKRQVDFTALQTSFAKKYGFIAPASMTNDYDAASAAEREYAFIADGSGKLGAADDDPFYIW